MNNSGYDDMINVTPGAMSGGLSVGGIATLRSDGAILTDCSIEWNKNVETLYTTLNQIMKIWNGQFAKKYTDAVIAIQPDLVDFANLLNKLSVKVKNIAAMFQATEDYGDVNQARLEEETKFDLVEIIKKAIAEEVTFNSAIIVEKGNEMLAVAGKIHEIINIIEAKKGDIASNYMSEGADEIVGKITKMYNASDQYTKAIVECGRALIENVAPQYDIIESYAKKDDV